MCATAIVLCTRRPLIWLSTLRHRSNVKSAAQTMPYLFHFIIARLPTSQYRFIIPVGPEDVRFKNGYTKRMCSMLNDYSTITSVHIRCLNSVFKRISPVQFSGAVNRIWFQCNMQQMNMHNCTCTYEFRFKGFYLLEIYS